MKNRIILPIIVSTGLGMFDCNQDQPTAPAPTPERQLEKMRHDTFGLRKLVQP